MTRFANSAAALTLFACAGMATSAPAASVAQVGSWAMLLMGLLFLAAGLRRKAGKTLEPIKISGKFPHNQA